MRDATDDERDAIRAALAELTGVSEPEVGLSPLGGGITNHNFRVDLSAGGTTQRLVARFGGRGTGELGIDRRREQIAMRVAAGLGVGAEVVHVDPQRDLVITRFIEGATPSERDVASPQMLTRVASTLRRIHDGPAFEGTFSPFATVRDYADRAARRGVQLPSEAEPALAVMSRVEAALGPPQRLAPCHNDLLPSNLIDDGRTIRIIDWEYAAMGDPWFDLGNFVVNASLDAVQSKLFIEAYAGSCTPRLLARLASMTVASDLREGFWGILQMAVSAIDFDFAAYAQRHLSRVLRAASSSQFEQSLRDAS